MEKQTDLQKPNIQDIGPNQPELELEKEVQQRLHEIEKKKKRFVLISRIIVAIVGILILLLIIAAASRNPGVPEIIEKEEPETPVSLEPDPHESWNIYDNSELKVLFKYPLDAAVETDTSFSSKVVYSSKEEEEAGYSFKITSLELYGRNLEGIAKIKRESYYYDCPRGAEVTNAVSIYVSDAVGKSFEVRGCNGDLKVTYVPRFNKFFEIVQTYQGSVGYKQQYKSTTEEILQTLVLYPEEKPPEEPFITFESQQYYFSFVYPKELKQNCCDIPAPPTSSNSIGTFGIKKDTGEFGGFRIFARNNESSNNKMTFEEFVQYQKNILISDYKVANGTIPVVVEEIMKLGSRDAVRFKGLSWKENDLVYSSVPGEKHFIIISISNSLGQDFERILDGIFESFKFE